MARKVLRLHERPQELGHGAHCRLPRNGCTITVNCRPGNAEPFSIPLIEHGARGLYFECIELECYKDRTWYVLEKAAEYVLVFKGGLPHYHITVWNVKAFFCNRSRKLLVLATSKALIMEIQDLRDS